MTYTPAMPADLDAVEEPPQRAGLPSRRSRGPVILVLCPLIALTAVVAAGAAALADAAAEEAAIRQRVECWTAAFNSHDAKGSCDLFAPNLAYSLQELPYGTYETMCGNLTRMLARTDIRLHYAHFPPSTRSLSRATSRWSG
jgi:hypothetical protein